MAATLEDGPCTGDTSALLSSSSFQTGFLISFLLLTLDGEELLPQVLLPPQLFLFLLLLHLHMLLVVQAPLFFGVFHFLVVDCAQST